jgi:hypothetical protein
MWYIRNQVKEFYEHPKFYNIKLSILWRLHWGRMCIGQRQKGNTKSLNIRIKLVYKICLTILRYLFHNVYNVTAWIAEIGVIQEMGEGL